MDNFSFCKRNAPIILTHSSSVYEHDMAAHAHRYYTCNVFGWKKKKQMVKVRHLQEWARENPQSVDDTQRNPDYGSHSNDPADPLSPGREDVVLIAGWFELDDGENQDNLPSEKKHLKCSCDTWMDFCFSGKIFSLNHADEKSLLTYSDQHWSNYQPTQSEEDVCSSSSHLFQVVWKSSHSCTRKATSVNSHVCFICILTFTAFDNEIVRCICVVLKIIKMCLLSELGASSH